MSALLCGICPWIFFPSTLLCCWLARLKWGAIHCQNDAVGTAGANFPSIIAKVGHFSQIYLPTNRNFCSEGDRCLLKVTDSTWVSWSEGPDGHIPGEGGGAPRNQRLCARLKKTTNQGPSAGERVRSGRNQTAESRAWILHMLKPSILIRYGCLFDLFCVFIWRVLWGIFLLQCSPSAKFSIGFAVNIKQKKTNCDRYEAGKW